MSIFIWLTFVNLYLVNLCLIFVGSFQVSSDSWDRNDHLGLISGQNCTFGCMGMFLLQSWRLSIANALKCMYKSRNKIKTKKPCINKSCVFLLENDHTHFYTHIFLSSVWLFELRSCQAGRAKHNFSSALQKKETYNDGLLITNVLHFMKQNADFHEGITQA
jgi:hypothetical protein